MKEFFLILLFSKTVLLTPEPVDLDGRIELAPDTPIEAITPGASIEIDVTPVIAWSGKEDITSFDKRLSDHFPPGGITATLVADGHENVALSYRGHHRFNGKRVVLSLDADHGVPPGVKFNRVIIQSNIKLEGVRVYWRNYKH